jgi:hypothetical protein
MVTQCKLETLPTSQDDNNESNLNLKTAIMNALYKFSAVDDQFIGRMSNEITIDPIAIYREM